MTCKSSSPIAMCMVSIDFRCHSYHTQRKIALLIYIEEHKSFVRFDSYGIVLDEQRVSEQINGENSEAREIVPACDIIRITGQPENVAAAKQALLDLVPITIQVSSYFRVVFVVRKRKKSKN